MSNQVESHPQAPRCAADLRLAVAGARRWSGEPAALAARAAALFADIATSVLDAAGASHAVAPARLTLLSGLADGADQCVATAFLSADSSRAVQREHVAVLPCRADEYRDRSPVSDKTGFDRLIAASTLVIELDGRMRPSDEALASDFSAHCRARAFRAQARLMLQRADVLLAVFDPGDPERAGGTVETVLQAIGADLPVLALTVTSTDPAPALYLLRNLAEVEALRSWRAGMTPIELVQQPHRMRELVAQLLRRAPIAPDPSPRKSLLEDVWTAFERKFDRGAAAPRPQGTDDAETASPFHALRQQVRDLSSRYGGRYRGAFLSNYRFAALATTLAATSLGLMVLGYKFIPDHWPSWIKAALLGLAVTKLALVVSIWRITELAHHRRWNELAVGARYLAENLRLLFWLPGLGKLRAPQRSGEHHTDERLARGDADAALRAAVRAAPAHTGLDLDTAAVPHRAKVNVRAALQSLQRFWLDGQLAYHQRNAAKLSTMVFTLDRRAKILNNVVIACVSLDIALLLAGIWLHLPVPLEVLKVLLIVTAAALPAAVASTNGIREQSEARRLAERSRQIAASLQGLGAEVESLVAAIDRVTGTDHDPGAWTLESLAVAEKCASLVAEDVAEWSVLYGKDVPET